MEEQMWRIEDYKNIADLSSRLYKRAIDLGAPDGFASHNAAFLELLSLLGI